MSVLAGGRTSTNATVERRHIPALDGVRGLAVIGVVMHHLGHLTGGYLGVDAFFVLSGFLITGLLVDEVASTGRVDLGRFWIRRAKRLFPALLALLAAVLVVERWIISDGVAARTLRDELLSSLTYVFNWQAIVSEVDYWDTFSAPSPLRHMWSLAIEEQFYVVWPLAVASVVWWSRRRRGGDVASRVAMVAAVLALASVAVGWWLYDGTNPLRIYYGTDTRIAAILIGSLAAVAVRRVPDLGVTPRRWIGGTGALLVVPVAWAWVALDGSDSTLYRGALPATGAATTLVIAAAVLAPDSALGRVLALRPLRWFGTISYGLYLWHWPMIVWLTPERTDLSGPSLLALRLAASLIATLVSHHLLEQPIRRSEPSGRQVFAATVPAIATVAALSLAGTASADAPQLAAGTRSTAPIPTRPPDPPAPVDSSVSAVVVDDGTDDEIGPVTAGERSPSSPLRLMVVGDSGAFFLGRLLDEAAADRAIVLQRGEIGCGVVNIGGAASTDDGTSLPDPDGCEEWPRRWVADAAVFEPDVTLIVLSWPGIGDRDLSSIGGGDASHPCDTDFDSHYAERIAIALDAAAAGGGRVAVATNPYYSGPGADGTFVERVDCLNAVMTNTAASRGAQIVDLAAWTCPDGACRIDVDGAPLRPDGLHFDGPGGAVAAEWVLTEVGA